MSGRPAPSGCLPDFVVGGVPKSGTTALFNCVSSHPAVFGCVPKEPHFFASEDGTVRVRGMRYELDSYQRLFAKKGPGQIAGEASTGYLHHARVAAPAMAALVPDVRLVFVLRDPVLRAYSDYWFRIHRGELPSGRSFSDYARLENHWLFSGGYYVDGLKTFFKHFRRSQVLILLSEDLRKTPRETVARVLRHVGVDSDGEDLRLGNDNTTRYPRFPQLLQFVGRLAPGVSSRAAKTPALRGVRSRMLFGSGREKPSIDPATLRLLRERYRPEVDALEELIQRDLSGWKRA